MMPSMRNLRVFALVCVAALAACDTTASEPQATLDCQELSADQVMIDVQHTSTVEGVRSALLEADTAFVYEDSSMLKLKGVNLEMFDPNGVRNATVVSVAGDYNASVGAMVARGNVVLVTKEGLRIETEELHYDPQTHRVWSDVKTRLRYPDGKSGTAETFSSDDQFTNLNATGATGSLPGVKITF
jgi:LPS export ABC transporter protein LptC